MGYWVIGFRLMGLDILKESEGEREREGQGKLQRPGRRRVWPTGDARERERNKKREKKKEEEKEEEEVGGWLVVV